MLSKTEHKTAKIQHHSTANVYQITITSPEEVEQGKVEITSKDFWLDITEFDHLKVCFENMIKTEMAFGRKFEGLDKEQMLKGWKRLSDNNFKEKYLKDEKQNR